ncbi:MAG: IS1634 family transposase [Actinobacteria bacterium]|nr:IS1634 family transposase [Actinomycetota bacterium]
MFFRKVTSKSNGKEYTYVKLIENYREGSKVKQRVIANLGNIEELTPEKVQGLVSGLNRICGMEDARDSFETKKVLHFGEVLAINKVWEALGATKIIQDLLPTEKSGVLPLLIELMVMNQVIKPRSKKTVCEWYRCLYLPQLEGRNLSPEHFAQALDAFISIKEPLEKRLFWAIQRLFPVKTGTVYCHLTRGFFERPVSGDEKQRGGRSFINRPPERKQVDMGILVNERGIPVGHRMFMGHFADGDTVPRRVSQVQQQYSVSQCIFVTDQKIITEDNVRLLVAYGYQYIIGLELRFNRDLGAIENYLDIPTESFDPLDDDLLYKEIRAGENRYMLCYNPEKASERISIMENRLNSIEKELANIQKWIAEGCSVNTKSNYYKANNLLKDTFCRRYFECIYDESKNSFNFSRRQDVIDREISLSGKFVIKTNCFNLPPQEIINAYTNYSGAREQFRVIKNNDTTTDFTESGLRGCVFISVLAYLVEKVLENILIKNSIEISARNALEILEDIKLTINEVHNREIRFITPAYGVQKDILSALGVVEVPRTLSKGAVL